MMSAKDARAKTLASINTKMSSAVNDIAVLINDSTTKGLVSCRYNVKTLTDNEISLVKDKLESLGYTVKSQKYYADQRSRDDIDTHHLMISW